MQGYPMTLHRIFGWDPKEENIKALLKILPKEDKTRLFLEKRQSKQRLLKKENKYAT